jgi:L-ascorbate metabolism protein UlaG (beta-lactamase superfamily)
MNQVDTAPLERTRAGTAAPDLWYLRPEVKIEPLMCGWPAWPHLLPPLQYAMNLAHRQLPNLKSFVANPWVHVAASSDPSMLGGPFVCLPETQVPAVRELIASTTEACCDLLEIARCFHEFDQKLQCSAKGLSLDDLYSQVPAPLQGFIELTYDINNHPKIRLLEELAYERWSRYTAALQEICIHTTADQDRPFFMSTPLLKADDRVVLRRPFRDPVVDILAAARCRPMSAAEIRCGLPEELSGEANFRRFFTTEPPMRNAPKYDGAGVRIRYFGHACVLVETSEMALLIDPLTAWQRDDSEATLTFLDLPDYIDYLVLTHGHQDHLVPDVLLQLRGRVGRVFAPRNDGGNIADPSLKLMLKTLGFHQITVMDPLDSVAIPDGSLTSLPFIGEHSGLDVLSKHCLLLKLYERRLLFMADSDIVDARLFEHLSDALGHIDVVFLGMECHGAPLTWFYGPLLSRQPSRREDESRRLSGSNFERARNAVSWIKPSRAYVYAMGQEPWLKGLMGLQYAPDSVQLRESNAFVEDCVARGIEARRLYGCSELVL